MATKAGKSVKLEFLQFSAIFFRKVEHQKCLCGGMSVPIFLIYILEAQALL